MSGPFSGKGARGRGRALVRGAIAAMTTAALTAASVVDIPTARAASPQSLTAAQVVELARRAAAAAAGPGAPKPGSAGSRPSPISEPAIHAEGDVAAGVGGTVEADPVEVSFSGSHASSVHVVVDGIAHDPLPAAHGLPAGAVEVGPAFEVTAANGAGASVTSFPTTFDVVRDEDSGIERAVNVVPGVKVTVALEREQLAAVDPATVRLYTREADDEPWSLVASYLDAATGEVHGELDHLSQFVVIGVPFQPDPGPVVVLDPDDDMANTDSPEGHVTELPFNYALAVAVAQELVTYCGATVVLTRDDGTPVVSQELRAAIAAAADPALTMTLAFNALSGHPWGIESDGGSQFYPREGDEALAEVLADVLPGFTGRPAKVLGSATFPYDDFLGLPGGLVHSETLFLDHNFDWPVIANGFGSIADGVFTGAATWLQSRGFDCTDRAEVGWPSPPSAADLARWRDLGVQNYQTYGAEPVNLVTGNLIEQFDLFSVSGAGGQSTDVTLTYNAMDDRDSRLGYGWTFSLGARAQRFSDGSVLIVRGDGASYSFAPDGAGFAGEPGTGGVGIGADGRVVWTDPQGGSWVFATEDVEGIGELVQYIDRLGRTLTLEYGSADGGQAFLPLASATDGAGQRITFGSDARGRISGVAAPDGRTWGLGYDDAGNLVAITDPAGGTQSFTYDEAHRMLTLIDPLGITYLTNEYDGAGRVAVQHDANGNVRTFAYEQIGAENRTVYTDNLGRAHAIWSDAGGRITAMVDPDGGVQRFAFDAAGNQISFTDEAGVTTTYAYDAAGNLIGKDGPAGVRSWTYDATHTVTSETVPDGAAGQTRTTLYEVTPQGLIASIADPAGGVASRTYDGSGNLVQAISPGGAVTAYEHDGRGNVTAVVDPGGGRTTIAYDGANRPVSVTDPGGQATTYSWDVLDRLTARTGADGATTSYEYDGNGHLVRTTAPDGGVTEYAWDGLFHLTSATDPIGRTTRYEYDAEDNLAAVIDPAGNRTSYAYGGTDRISSMTDPDGGVTSYAYDPVGRLIQVTAPGGGVTTYAYTAAGQVESVTDPTGGTTAYGYDAANRLVAVVDPLGNTTTYAYDMLDRVIAVTDEAGESITYAYDPDGNVTAATDRRGWTSTYGYDPLGRLVSVADPAGAVTKAVYDAVGNLTGVTDPLGAVTSYAYDAAYRLAVVTDPLGGTTAYGYDPAGRRVSVTDQIGAVTSLAYDLAGQLTATTDPTGLVTAYAYDPAGRVLDMTDPTGLVTRYAYDGRGNVTAATLNPGPVPGPNQNMSWLYSWDADSRLTSVTDPEGRATTYAYDAAGRLSGRTLPTGGTSSQAHDMAGQVISAVDPLGNVTKYRYDARGDVSEIDYSGTTVAYEYDSGRNMIAMTDPTGATAWSYDKTGRLTSQLDATGRWLGYAYDAAGRLSAQQLVAGVDAPAASKLVAAISADPRAAALPAADAILTTAYSYDEAGRAITQSSTVTPAADDPRTFTAGYMYDPAGRVTQLRRTNPDGSPAVTSTYAYDGAGRTTAIAHITPQSAAGAAAPAAPAPAAGEPCVGVAPTGSVEVPCLSAADYLASRVLPVAKPVVAAGQGIRLDYAYEGGRVASATRSTGVVTAAPGAFDPAAGVSAAQNAGLSAAQVAAGGASGGGALPGGIAGGQSPASGSLPVIGETTRYGYDRLGRLIAASSSTGVTDAFAWDAAGSRTAWATSDDPLTTAVGDPVSVSWALDDAGLPATADVTSADGQSAKVSYGWDRAGSRTSVAVSGNASLSSLWGQTSTWDAAGRVASVSTNDRSVFYSYDGLGRRAGATTTDSTGSQSSASSVFDGLGPLASVTAGEVHGQSTGEDWDVWVRDVLGGRLLESATALAGTVDGTDRWALLDDLGSLIAQGPATGSGAGTITQSMGWSAFGIAQPATTGWDETAGFSGQATELALAQVEFHARILDSITGGWTSTDTWAGLLTVPATLNHHAYVLGDPINNIDILGYWGVPKFVKNAVNTVVNTAKTVAGYLDPRNDPTSVYYGAGSSSGTSPSTPGPIIPAEMGPGPPAGGGTDGTAGGAGTGGSGGGSGTGNTAITDANVQQPTDLSSQRHQPGTCTNTHGCTGFDAAIDLFSYRGWIDAWSYLFQGDLAGFLEGALGALPGSATTRALKYPGTAGAHRYGPGGGIKMIGGQYIAVRVVARLVLPAGVAATVIDYLWHQPPTPTQIYYNDCYGQWCSFPVDYGIPV